MGIDMANFAGRPSLSVTVEFPPEIDRRVVVMGPVGVRRLYQRGPHEGRKAGDRTPAC